MRERAEVDGDDNRSRPDERAALALGDRPTVGIGCGEDSTDEEGLVRGVLVGESGGGSPVDRVRLEGQKRTRVDLDRNGSVPASGRAEGVGSGREDNSGGERRRERNQTSHAVESRS